MLLCFEKCILLNYLKSELENKRNESESEKEQKRLKEIKREILSIEIKLLFKKKEVYNCMIQNDIC